MGSYPGGSFAPLDHHSTRPRHGLQLPPNSPGLGPPRIRPGARSRLAPVSPRMAPIRRGGGGRNGGRGIGVERGALTGALRAPSLPLPRPCRPSEGEGGGGLDTPRGGRAGPLARSLDVVPPLPRRGGGGVARDVARRGEGGRPPCATPLPLKPAFTYGNQHPAAYYSDQWFVGVGWAPTVGGMTGLLT